MERDRAPRSLPRFLVHPQSTNRPLRWGKITKACGGGSYRCVSHVKCYQTHIVIYL